MLDVSQPYPIGESKRHTTTKSLRKSTGQIVFRCQLHNPSRQIVIAWPDPIREDHRFGAILFNCKACSSVIDRPPLTSSLSTVSDERLDHETSISVDRCINSPVGGVQRIPYIPLRDENRANIVRLDAAMTEAQSNTNYGRDDGNGKIWHFHQPVQERNYQVPYGRNRPTASISATMSSTRTYSANPWNGYSNINKDNIEERKVVPIRRAG